jgi:TolB-like protein
MAAAPDFARKFGLILKAFNISRGQLSQVVGVDKSVVSRWASGVQGPTDHNLMLLTEAVARYKPDFVRLDWDLDIATFAARLAAGGTPSSPGERPALALPDRPSVAVLPFSSLGGMPEQAYFADGVVEDIIAALSRFRTLFVIARSSSFTYRGGAVDVRQVGRELGVRYVLQGSVRRASGQLRCTAQLIDAITGGFVWADRFDGPVEDLFEVQDRITDAVVGVLEPAIQQAEIERMRHKRPEHMGAYDFYLRSLALTDTFTRVSVDAMLDACRRAIALDPSFAPAYALAVKSDRLLGARAYIQRLIQGWLIDPARETNEALDLVERGLAANRHDPLMLATAGHCFAWFGRDLAKGIAYIDEAIAITPNLLPALLASGMVRTRAGQSGAAIDHLERARRLSPRDSRNYAIFQALAVAHHVDDDPETACGWARRAVQHNPNYLPGWIALAASAANAGRDDEARSAAAQVIVLEPAASIARLHGRYPTSVPEKFEKILDGLRRAGIPD